NIGTSFCAGREEEGGGMERACEEANTQESTRRGPRQVRWPSSERGQEAGQPEKRTQGGPGQKPQEANCPAAGCAPSGAKETPEQLVRSVITSIRARFGYQAIGLGCGGIRFSLRGLG